MLTQEKTESMDSNSCKQGRFQMSYKRKEVPIYYPMEQSLMEELGIASRCDLHKYAIKFLNASRKNSDLILV